MTNKPLSLYKFILCLIIVTLHSNYIFVPQGYLAVESFFLISGFFIGFSTDKIQSSSMRRLVVHRISSIYFFYLIAISVASVRDYIYGSANLIKHICIYLFGLQVFLITPASGKMVGSVGYLWYIPVYIHISFFIIFLVKNIKRPKLYFAVILVVTISSVIMIFDSPSAGFNFTNERFKQPIPIGYLRGVITMSLGFLGASLLKYFNSSQNSILFRNVLFSCPPPPVRKLLLSNNLKFKYFVYISLSILELVCIGCMLAIMFHEITDQFDYDYIILSWVFIGLCFIRKGVLTQFMNLVGGIKFIQPILSLAPAVYFFHYIFIDEYLRIVGDYVSPQDLPFIFIITLGFGALMSSFKHLIYKKVIRYAKGDAQCE